MTQDQVIQVLKKVVAENQNKDYMKETAIMEARGCLASVAYDTRARGEQA